MMKDDTQRNNAEGEAQNQNLSRRNLILASTALAAAAAVPGAEIAQAQKKPAAQPNRRRSPNRRHSLHQRNPGRNRISSLSWATISA
jgi:hypothetical protein